MGASLSGVFNAQQFTDMGAPLVGGRLYTYAPSTTTLKIAYTDPAGSIPHTYTYDGSGGQYIALDARGELPAPLFLVAGGYDLTLRRADGTIVWTRRAYGTDAGADTLRADLLTESAGKGAASVAWRNSKTALQGLDFLAGVVVNVCDPQYGAVGDGVTDDTAAIQAAIADLQRFGVAGYRSCGLYFPMPGAKYKVTAPLVIKGQQGLRIYGEHCQIDGNFAGPVLDLGNISGTADDMLRVHVENLVVVQNSTAAGSGAVRARHMYESSFRDCYFFGGRIAFELDGNANLISCCTFRNGQDANVKTGASANNEANIFHCCSNELSAGYGYDLSVISGNGGFTIIDGGYCERNAAGNIYVTNSQKTTIRDVYVNLQNGASGVILGGTIGAGYTAPRVSVTGCRVLGADSGTPKFIEELSANSIGCQYADNSVESGNCDLYGSATKSINLRRSRKFSSITNGQSIVNSDSTGSSDGWTLASGGTGNVGAVSSVSPYITGSACSISSANQYQYQQISVPANSLIRISVWAKCSGALATSALQIWAAALSGQYAATSTTSTTANKLEIYLTPAQRSNATSILIMLRNTGSGDAAQFNDIEIEDMTV